MIENVNKIKSNSFDSIKKDGVLTMLLLRTYSILYKDGKQVRTCERSMYKYYNEILKTGEMKANIKEEIKNRTLVPNFEGRKEIYTKNGIVLINSDHLTDAEALKLLSEKVLKKEDFKSLPNPKKKDSEVKNSEEVQTPKTDK